MKPKYEFWLKDWKVDREFDCFETTVSQVRPDFTKHIWKDFIKSKRVVDAESYQVLERKLAKVEKKLELAVEALDRYTSNPENWDKSQDEWYSTIAKQALAEIEGKTK